MLIVDTPFSTWLVGQLNIKNWSHRELGRQAGVSGAAVSRVISGEQNPGFDFCMAVAKAFGEQPEKILRLAGLLPPEPAQAQNEDQLLDVFRRLSAAQQRFLLDAARGLAGQVRPAPAAIREQGEEYTISALGDNASVPEDEDIMNVLSLLDEPERVFVYDFVQWRLNEQRQRRSSSGMRRRYSIKEIEDWLNTLSPAAQRGIFLNALVQLRMQGFDIPALTPLGAVSGDPGRETEKQQSNE